MYKLLLQTHLYIDISVLVFINSTMKGVIIIEEKRKVDFHSTQLYINKKEDMMQDNLSKKEYKDPFKG